MATKKTDFAPAGGSVSFVWHDEDVIEKASDMGYNISVEDAQRILTMMKKYHDCNEGMNWTVIETMIRMYMSFE